MSITLPGVEFSPTSPHPIEFSRFTEHSFVGQEAKRAATTYPIRDVERERRKDKRQNLYELRVSSILQTHTRINTTAGRRFGAPTDEHLSGAHRWPRRVC